MANKEHLKIIRRGATYWNAWRQTEGSGIRPDLNGVDLSSAALRGADLSHADLTAANLTAANLYETDFKEANLSAASLRRANLGNGDLDSAILRLTDLTEANLCSANFSFANFIYATLTGAELFRANLSAANLLYVQLNGASLQEATFHRTTVADTDLSEVKGLEYVTHLGQSTIGVDTLYRSQGHIPEVFLRGAGLPEEFITQIPALIASVSPIQFQSCFISYSHQDEEFARRLHAAMRAENLRVWFAPEEMKGGKKLHEQIFQAIQVHDRLLLVLSTESMKSEWVMTEIRRAKKVEREQGRRKLFPIRLVNFETIQNWECFDADSGKDLAAEVRGYYIPDFSNWKDHDSFEREFAKLLRDLKATEK